MKKLLLISTLLVFSILLNSCNLAKDMLFRYETDTYTKTERDTVFNYHVKNAPGNRDNGIVYPSSKVITKERYVSQYDSVVKRKFPDFIRVGFFEGVGIFGGAQKNSIGTGLFGIHPSLSNLDTEFRGDESAFVPGGIYRVGIYEHRLRWFRDAPGWTIGTSIYEAIVPDARTERTLTSILPIYIRKRYYLREEIPYISWGPQFGIGLYPSQYVNAAMALEIGSIGGLNIRAYAGLAAGANQTFTNQVEGSDFVDEAQTVVQPYFGLGVSVLDFRNRVPELYKEYKDHDHSSWYVGWAEFYIVNSNTEQSAFGEFEEGDLPESQVFNGFIFRFANAGVALPILNHKLYAGTSLINMIILGRNDFGLSFLPIRIGYWNELIKDELAIDPFFEYNYYPSQMYNFGARVNLRIFDNLSLSGVLGYISGSTITNDDLGDDLIEQFGNPTDFSNYYFGIGINANRVFFERELRYFK